MGKLLIVYSSVAAMVNAKVTVRTERDHGFGRIWATASDFVDMMGVEIRLACPAGEWSWITAAFTDSISPPFHVPSNCVRSIILDGRPLSTLRNGVGCSGLARALT
ncbi:hypothetical protein GCM10009000_081580 [Halobacterium noricense]|uniref:Uncharacterized protein n=1 Tax=Haladaptatus pallidirubidus TaxID=1008152 RepID=A0AAV3UPX5_9EURY